MSSKEFIEFIESIKVCMNIYHGVSGAKITSTYNKPTTTFTVRYKETKFTLDTNSLNSSILARKFCQRLSELIPDFEYKVDYKYQINKAIEEGLRIKLGFISKVLYNKKQNRYRFHFKYFKSYSDDVLVSDYYPDNQNEQNFVQKTIYDINNKHPEFFL